jgi:hypothetical protein
MKQLFSFLFQIPAKKALAGAMESMAYYEEK